MKDLFVTEGNIPVESWEKEENRLKLRHPCDNSEHF